MVVLQGAADGHARKILKFDAARRLGPIPTTGHAIHLTAVARRAGLIAADLAASLSSQKRESSADEFKHTDALTPSDLRTSHSPMTSPAFHSHAQMVGSRARNVARER